MAVSYARNGSCGLVHAACVELVAQPFLAVRLSRRSDVRSPACHPERSRGIVAGLNDRHGHWKQYAVSALLLPPPFRRPSFASGVYPDPVGASQMLLRDALSAFRMGLRNRAQQADFFLHSRSECRPAQSRYSAASSVFCSMNLSSLSSPPPAEEWRLTRGRGAAQMGGRELRARIPGSAHGAVVWPGPPQAVVHSSNRSRMEVVRSATTSSCLTHRIPPGPSSGSHTTVRASRSTRCFPAAIGGGGAFQQAERLVRLATAGQVKYARLQHRLQREEGRPSFAGAAVNRFGMGVIEISSGGASLGALVAGCSIEHSVLWRAVRPV